MVFAKEVTYTVVIMQLFRQVILAACAFGVVVSATAEPRALDNYKSIIDRNPFGLKDPPKIEPPQTNAPPKDIKKEEFYLTGISTIGTPKRPKAYLIAKDSQKKDYDQKFYNLTVGDRQGDVQLQEIDEKGRRVRIVYLGEEKWLSMKENGVPAPAGPAPGPPGIPNPAMPGQPIPPGAVPLPGAAPVAQPQPLNYPNANNRRTPRSSPGVGAAYSSSILPSPSGAGNNSANHGPQSEAELLQQIATMQNPHAAGTLPANIPAPPVPHL